jgi:hypothetical protein
MLSLSCFVQSTQRVTPLDHDISGKYTMLIDAIFIKDRYRDIADSMVPLYDFQFVVTESNTLKEQFL